MDELRLNGRTPETQRMADRSWTARFGRRAAQHYRLCAAAVLGLAAFNLLFRLHNSQINNWDESVYGIMAQEMLQSGQWLVTTYAGQTDYWFLKPPLGIWMIATSYWALGYSAFALRLPSAACALIGIGVLMAVTRSWLGRRIALLAGLILATCFPYLVQHSGRSGDMDAPLTLIVIVAMGCLLRFRQGDAYAWGFGLMVALGFLLKGFAVIQILAVSAAYLLLSRDVTRVPPARWLYGSLAALIPIALWVFARYRHDGVVFLGRIVSEDVVLRAQTTMGAPPFHPLYYVGFLLDRMSPWSEVAVATMIWVAVRAWRGTAVIRSLRPRRPVLLLILWTLVPLVLFSASRTQHHWYINPILPALAALSALAVVTLARSLRPAAMGAIVVSVALGLALCQLRVTEHLLTKATMKDDQRFLLSLRVLTGETEIHGLRPWTQTERFILQVLGGFRLDVQSPPSGQGRMLLVDRTADALEGTLLGESPGYRLIAVEPRRH